MRTVALLIAFTLLAACGSRSGIQIEHAWARATPPGSTVGAAYAVIDSAHADELIALSSPVAQRVEMHATFEEDGALRMRPVDRIAIRANSPLAFEAGSLHLMLIGLHEPLAAGSTFPLTFTFESAGAVTIDVNVAAPGDEPMFH